MKGKCYHRRESISRNVLVDGAWYRVLGRWIKSHQQPIAHSRKLPRSGITLLEIVIALAILLASLAVMSELLRTGSRAAVEAQTESEAVLRAETVLSEIIAGVYPPIDVELQDFEDDLDWKWTLHTYDGPHADLIRLEVTVTLQPQGSDDVITSYTLTRLTRDPQIFVDTALE